MSIAKVIDRKNSVVLEIAKKKKKEAEIIEMFRAYVVSQQSELEKLFPYVIIGEYNKDILGVSYTSSATTMSGGKSVICSSTHNIVMDSLKYNFNVGFSANTASGLIRIPYSLEMTKPQLKRLFKQVVEALVSGAYSAHSKKDWMIREEVSSYYKTHKRVRRLDLNHNFMLDNAEIFQRGGTHDYFKMDGKLFVSAYGREIYEFVMKENV